MKTLIGYLIVALVVLRKPIVAGVERAYSALKNRTPSGKSIASTIGGVLGYEFKIPAWEALLLAVAIGLITGGGSSLPDWKIPGWPAWLHVNTLPLSGMRVLILDETAPAKPLTPEQTLALRSLEVREYLDGKTLADSKGGKGWRKIDPDSSVSDLPQEWQTIRANVKPTEYPWVAVADSDGKIVFQGPYPPTDTLAFFKKYGG